MRWTQSGWLSSPAYYAFWGKVFSGDLGVYFRNRDVTDIGAGNGLIWEFALKNGLVVKKLNLIDPDLHIGRDLSNHSMVHTFPVALEQLQTLKTEVAVFKQSFHMIYTNIGTRLFEIVTADTFINIAMRTDIDWPVSDSFKSLFNPTCPNVRQIMQDSDKRIMDERVYSYPVVMPRDVWIAMLRGRFVSCLQHCSAASVEREVAWAQKELPDMLTFNDTLECLVYASRCKA